MTTLEFAERFTPEVAHRYEFIRELGRGGIASVYEVFDRSARLNIAMKILHPQLANSQQSRERLHKEYETLASLHHPGIVTPFEFEAPEGSPPFFTLELISGESLEQRAKTGAITLATSIEILKQISNALGYIHERGALFCDLKPSNVMLRGDGATPNCVLIDFGLVHPIISKQSKNQVGGIASGGAMVGTSLYMAPEQVRSGHLTPATDIYSFGVLAYELLTGTTPFNGNDTYVITASHLLGEVPDVSKINHEVPRDLARLIRVALAKEPRDRYQSMWEVYDRLQRIAPPNAHASAKSGGFRGLLRGIFG